MARDLEITIAPLTLDLEYIGTSELETLADQGRINRERAKQKAKSDKIMAQRNGEEVDRQRVLDAFKKTDIRKAIVCSIQKGDNSFLIFLNSRDVNQTSGLWNPRKTVSKTVMRELNDSLKAHTALTSASFVKNSKFAFKDMATTGFAFTFFGGGIGGIIGSNILTSALSTGWVPTILLYGISAVASFDIGIRVAETIDYNAKDFHESDQLEIHFKKPNGLARISGHALSALSIAAVGIKDKILEPFRPSPEQRRILQKEFSEKFRDAVQNVADNCVELEKHAVSKGLNFSVAVDQFIELGNRQIQIVKSNKNGRSSLLEKRAIYPLQDLSKAIAQAAKMVTIEQNDLDEITTAFDKVVGIVKSNVRDYESKQAMAILSDIEVGVVSAQRYIR